MLSQAKRKFEPVPAAINIQLFLALTGSLITLIQTMLIIIQGDILCLNEGCEIVESLTRVPPIVFNLAGFCFFQAIFWSLWMGRNGDRLWLDRVRLLLLVGMAAEGVLVSFQQYISEVYCSYCLIIFCLILLLTLLAGVRQAVKGCVIFAAVLIAFSSLQFKSVNEQAAVSSVSLDSGTFARIKNPAAPEQLYLFFSSTCVYCEEIIATIDDDFSCDLRFNPIDRLDSFAVVQAEPAAEYRPEVNLGFLKSLGINEIPVLMVKGDSEISVLRGKQRIQEFIDRSCREVDTVAEDEILEGSSHQNVSPYGFDYLSPSSPDDDACSVTEDCEEVEEQPATE